MISEAIKPLQLVGQAAECKFESKFEPLPIIRQSLRRLFQKVIECLEGKINGQALGAALRLCLRGSDGRAQTQGDSEPAAVAAGRDRLAGGKHATTRAILTQFKNQQGNNSCFCKFWAATSHFFFHMVEKLLPTKAASMASLNLSIRLVSE